MKITGYLIDPEHRSLTQHEVEQHDIQAIYALIGADCFDTARFDRNGDLVFVDDEGLLKEPTFGFLIKGYPTPLAGRGFVLGTDGPDSVSAKTPYTEIQRRVRCLAAQPMTSTPGDTRKKLVDIGPLEIVRPR